MCTNTSGGRFACVAHISKWIYFIFNSVSIKSGEVNLLSRTRKYGTYLYARSVQSNNHSSCLFIARMAKVADVGLFLFWYGSLRRFAREQTRRQRSVSACVCVRCVTKICDLFAQENMFAVTRPNWFSLFSLNPPSPESSRTNTEREWWS